MLNILSVCMMPALSPKFGLNLPSMPPYNHAALRHTHFQADKDLVLHSSQTRTSAYIRCPCEL